MEKPQLERLVRTIYATYNTQLNKMDEAIIFRAWWQLLSDLEYKYVWAAFNNMAVHSDFIPRPGQLRRAAIDLIDGGGRHPDGASAWGILQAMRKATEGGQFYEGSRPEALTLATEQLGASAFDMHTNGDRETFLRVYSKVVEKLEQTRYKRGDNLTVVDEDFII
jgi:hypothetical protein